jgi:ABC-type cobalamin/Fe3+-siderophores transport system ATPase subunit
VNANSKSNTIACLREPFLYVPQEEHPEKNAWWINELESLGVDTESNANESNNKQDNSDLAEAIKQTFMEEYKQATYDQ